MPNLKYCLLLFVLLTSPIRAATIFYTQSGAGSQTGADCANAFPISHANAGATDWVAGNILHMCVGTFTGSPGSTMLTTHGSGSLGNTITIQLDPAGVITAPYWAYSLNSNAGAVIIQNSFITFDGTTPCGPGTACRAGGGTGTGLITASANGTGLANSQDNTGIYISTAAHDVEIKNFACTNLYVRIAATANTTGGGTQCIHIDEGAGGNIKIHDITMHDMRTGIGANVQATLSGDKYYNLDIYNRDNAVAYTVGASNITVTGFEFHDSHVGGSSLWDDPGDGFHHDGFHGFLGGGLTGSAIDGALFYNLTMDGFLSDPTVCTGGGGVGPPSCATSEIFLENVLTNAKVFNNVINVTGITTDGAIFFAVGSVGGKAYNNTVVYAGSAGSCIALQGTSSVTLENNILSNCSAGVNIEDSGSDTGFVSHNNDYFNAVHWAWGGAQVSSFASWQSICSCDASPSGTFNPLLNSDGTLQAGSGAIGAALNLTSLGITPLDKDAAGVTRPASAAWDMGAFQFSAVSSTPTVQTKGNTQFKGRVTIK